MHHTPYILYPKDFQPKALHVQDFLRYYLTRTNVVAAVLLQEERDTR